MSNPYSKNKHCKCGKLITNNAKLCCSCFNFTLRKPIKKYYCRECKKIITENAKYCKSCAQKGERNSAFTNGNTLAITCKCGNKKDYRAKICKKCYYVFNKGKNHGSWKGGISKLPYPFEFHIIKESVILRDYSKCQLCNKTNEQEIKNINRKLTVHHIDYNKQNCKEDNLITLCTKCNSKVNFNRDYWYAYFTYLMENYIYG